MGPAIHSDLQDHLFFNKCSPEINDLAAVDIQRGRDFGLPGYVYFLQYLTGAQIKSWTDLEEHIPRNYLTKLEHYYRSVLCLWKYDHAKFIELFWSDFRDIDLFVGGVLEDPMKTFWQLIAIQFYHRKFGDRFYFEHSGQPGSFNKGKIKVSASSFW